MEDSERERLHSTCKIRYCSCSKDIVHVQYTETQEYAQVYTLLAVKGGVGETEMQMFNITETYRNNWQKFARTWPSREKWERVRGVSKALKVLL